MTLLSRFARVLNRNQRIARRCWPVGILLLTSFAAAAAAAATAQPVSAEKRASACAQRENNLDEQMLRALGGRARWAALTTLVNDSYQQRSSAPNTVRARISMDLRQDRWRIETTAPNLHLIRVVDARSQTGWRLTEAGAVEDLRWHRGHVYRSIHRIAKRDPALRLRCKDDRLEAFEGKTRLVWFRLSSNGEPYAFGALEDDIGTRSGPWRFEQDGLRHPIWVSNASGTWRADLQALQVNAALDPQLFVRPKFLHGAAALPGAWHGAGSFQGNAVDMSLTIEPILGGAFTEWQIGINAGPQTLFEGKLHTRRDLAGLYGDWRDSSGAQYRVASELLGDCLVSDWGKGHSKYCLSAIDQMRVTDFARGVQTPFAEYVLTRAPKQSAAADGKQKTAPACRDPKFREFDFWLGDWQVEAKGKLIAYNQITLAQNGCVLRENYSVQSTGYLGQSLNMYDATRGQWQQTWVDNGGLMLQLSGGLQGAAMVLEGTRQTRQDDALVTVQERIRWTPNADGTVRQLWQTRRAGNSEWTTSFDGIYRRRQSQ
jgi:hypothetical protein